MALRIVIGDVTIGIQGQDFSYLFSVGCGGMESLYKDGKEWLYRSPRPAFWRAVYKHGIQENMIIEFKVIEPDGKELASNIRVTKSDLELFENLKKMITDQ